MDAARSEPRNSHPAMIKAPRALSLLTDTAQQSQETPATTAARAEPDVEVVADFERYDVAEQAVDMLVGRGFPVEHVFVRGVGLRMVEEILGPITYRGVVKQGVIAGALAGALIAASFGLLGLLEGSASAGLVLVSGASLGSVVGAGLAALARWLEEGRRDFLSETRLTAAHYELLCDEAVADEARRVLRPLFA